MGLEKQSGLGSLYKTTNDGTGEVVRSGITL